MHTTTILIRTLTSAILLLNIEAPQSTYTSTKSLTLSHTLIPFSNKCFNAWLVKGRVLVESMVKMAESMGLEDWMAEEVTVSTALHKEHDQNALGTSKVTSAAEFKAECVAAGILEPGQLQTWDPRTVDDALCREMGITIAALKEVEKNCE